MPTDHIVHVIPEQQGIDELARRLNHSRLPPAKAVYKRGESHRSGDNLKCFAPLTLAITIRAEGKPIDAQAISRITAFWARQDRSQIRETFADDLLYE